MTVYVESNFVLEIALLQEEHAECTAIVDLCKQPSVRLVIPVFSLAEPEMAIRQKNNRRKELNNRLLPELKELARTHSYQNLKPAMDSITALLVTSQEDETSRLSTALQDLTICAEIIPLGQAVFVSALTHQSQTKLGLPDAIVLASILDHLDSTQPNASCFLNKNKKDFEDPDVEFQLTTRNCKLIPRFRDGLAYIKGQSTP